MIKPGITVEASIRLEACVHVVVETSLNAGLELLRTILTLEVLSLVSSQHPVNVQSPSYLVSSVPMLVSPEQVFSVEAKL